eukprot:2191854-Ditylum_brightwellii.AAC.1
MMIQRDTEARNDDDDGVIKEAAEKSKQAALLSMYIMDKERPAVETMEIVPAGSTYDECALQY